MAKTDSLFDDQQWDVAWQRARDAGPVVVPVLQARLLRERQPGRRLLWIGAVVAAAGSGGVAEVLTATRFRSTRRQEQVMALWATSLVSGASPDGEVIRSALSGVSSSAVRISGAIALARHRVELALPRDWFGNSRKDPGLWAAGALSGTGLPVAEIGRWRTQESVPDALEQLRWRALLFSELTSPDLAAACDALAKRALTQDGEAMAPLRNAAAVRLARNPTDATWPEGVPPAELVTVLALTPAGRALVRGRGWAEAMPSALLELAERRRRVAVYALTASDEELAAAFPGWQKQPELLSAIALATAWRAYEVDADLEAGSWVVLLDEVPEARWLRLALRLDGAELDPADGDARFALARSGRISRAAQRAEVQDRLWRSGAHPGAESSAAWFGLCRDLLLSGSDFLRYHEARSEAYPYLPPDLQAGDREFFEVAHAYLEWAASDLQRVPERFWLR